MTLGQTILIAVGILAVGLGTLGIFLPLLPTTPFLLLAAYCFARSSRRLYVWLLSHRLLGPYIHAFRNKTGLTRTQKIRIGLSFTVLLAVSFYIAPIPSIKALLAGIWVLCTIVLLRIKTRQGPACAETAEERKQLKPDFGTPGRCP
jgi:hypothetical protein